MDCRGAIALCRSGCFTIERAAKLGHPEAQRMVANFRASGILLLSNHSLMVCLAEWWYHCSRGGDDSIVVSEGDNNNICGGHCLSILLRSTVEVADNFFPTSSHRGEGRGQGKQRTLQGRGTLAGGAALPCHGAVASVGHVRQR